MKYSRKGKEMVELYSLYGIGVEDSHTIFFLLFHALLFFSLSLLVLLYFPRLTHHFLRCSLAFSGSFLALVSLCLLAAAAHVLHSSLPLRHRVAHRIAASVPDWSTVRTALDLGCSRGILLNAVALHLKKSGSSGRVVGLDPRRETAVQALLRARAEGVQEYVTCREGDARKLPFADGWFDVVVSAAHFSSSTASLEEEEDKDRGKGVAEMVRVMRPGGLGVVWDLGWVPGLVDKLTEMRMEDIRVSPRITAYMVSTRIVSFRKPLLEQLPMEWTANIC